MKFDVVSRTYLDADGNIRTLVSIYEGDRPVQTVGSWMYDDPAVLTAQSACLRTLNVHSASCASCKES